MRTNALTMTQKVADLHSLRNPVINVVLHKLEEVQTEIGILKQDPTPVVGAIRQALTREALLRDLITEMYEQAVWQAQHGYQPGAPQTD